MCVPGTWPSPAWKERVERLSDEQGRCMFSGELGLAVVKFQALQFL